VVLSKEVPFGGEKIYFISFHLFADNIAIYKADTVILGCRSITSYVVPIEKNKVKK